MDNADNRNRISTKSTPALILSDKRALRRVSNGFQWVYANELPSMKGIEPGEWVELLTPKGEFIAAGTINPHSLIAVRILSRQRSTPNTAFFLKRIQSAMRFREKLVDLNNCRLVFAEADGLPGFITDILGGQVLSIQLNTAGAERLKTPYLCALREIFGNLPIMLKNENIFRQAEGLETESIALGSVPEKVELLENGLKILVPAKTGQKTGYYFDQRENKRLFRRFARGNVLDCFSYVGGFGLNAAAAGAEHVTFVDSSETALEFCRQNMELNRLGKGSYIQNDGFKALQQFAEENRKFDLISLDPPAFVKNRKSLAKAEKAYTRLNRMALNLLNPGGVLFTMSCSRLMDSARFDLVLSKALSSAGIRGQVIGRLHQAADHPVLPAMRETEYLKGIILKRES
ncbi:MAG: class I SAM-dependent rRNA methyltransferase [Acidobacteria bacterium]|nr:class I SAM-dependent rRNA methyltransferase [Acidobacteriota bacterium]